MTDIAIETIRNYRLVDDRLATSGQPSEEHLKVIAATGYEVVINLALHDDPRYSLPNETATVQSLGMKYIHIPVQFSCPTEESLLTFFEAMKTHHNNRVWVHCAANWRVPVFVGLFRSIVDGWENDEAFKLLHATWEPNEVWSTFISSMLVKLGG